MENLEKLKEENKITENQYKGILLEIATYQALRELGIQPIPLHNPFDEEYAKDYHLGVDLIFYHNGLLCGVECKNLCPKGYLTKEWINEEIVERFENITSIVSIDVRIVVTSHYKNTLLEYLGNDYSILQLGFQMKSLEDIMYATFTTKNLFLSLFKQNRYNTILEPIHGYKNYYGKLRYIRKKLLDEWIEDKKEM